MGAEAVRPGAVVGLWAGLAVLMLSGFSSLPGTYVVNNSGVPLTIETPRRAFLKRAIVRPGHGRWVGVVSRLVLAAGNCSYRYNLPGGQGILAFVLSRWGIEPRGSG